MPDNSQIIAAAESAAIRSYRWMNRGRAPAGYINGMAVAFAQGLRGLRAGDPFATAMAEAPSGLPKKDVLTWYADLLQTAGLPGDTAEERLIQLFTILTGLGMRESSGQHCEGRDMSTDNVSAQTAEAGLFQVSHNSIGGHPLLDDLFEAYEGRDDLLDIFDDGVHCRAASWQDWGEGPGREFQSLTKRCPEFAVFYAALLSRRLRAHWGPINRREAEVKPEMAALLRQVAAVVAAE